LGLTHYQAQPRLGLASAKPTVSGLDTLPSPTMAGSGFGQT